MGQTPTQKLAARKLVSLGENTAWGKQFLTSLAQSNLVEIVYENSVQRFIDTQKTTGAEMVIFENQPDCRNHIIKLKQTGRRLYVLWFGRNFTKEDLIFAVEHRIYCVFENLRAEEARVLENVSKLSARMDEITEFEQILRSLKSILLQAEAEIPKAVLGEIKTAVGKLEHHGVRDEFAAVNQDSASGADAKLPFHKAQDFGDALTTVHNLERTGVLWVRGNLPNQEGKVEFLQGRITAATTGDVHAMKAIFRMFLWDEPRFLFTRRDARESMMQEHLNSNIKYICLEGMDYKKRYDRVRRELPPADLKVELDPSSLHIGTSLIQEDFDALASVVEFNKVGDVLDFNPMPDAILYEALIRLRKSGTIRVATK